MTEKQMCFQLKASFSPCAVLQLTHYDLEAFQQQLIETKNKAPNFFVGSPVIIDIEALKNLGTLDFNQIKQMLTANGMVPVGIRGGSLEQQSWAATVGIPAVSASKAALTEAPKKRSVPQPKTVAAKFINHPIRSGMQIYAKESDLIIVAPVSAGAEVMADGNIHIYGPLRGRALAGVQGNTQARIFCRSLDAELVSIAGYYLMKDDLHKLGTFDTAVQVFLKGEQLEIQRI